MTVFPCEPMPGPLGAFWPTAKPGIDYCGPYPACCPPVARPWWQHLIGLLNQIYHTGREQAPMVVTLRASGSGGRNSELNYRTLSVEIDPTKITVV